MKDKMVHPAIFSIYEPEDVGVEGKWSKEWEQIYTQEIRLEGLLPEAHVLFVDDPVFITLEEIVRKQQEEGFDYRAKGYQVQEGIVFYHGRIWVPTEC